MELAYNRQLNMTTKYQLSAIIAALEENKKKHVEEFPLAKKGYFDKLTELQVQLNLARNDNKLSETRKILSEMNALQPPVYYAGNYDKKIFVFKQSSEDLIELDYEDANAIFNDEWDFNSSKFLNSTYATSASSR
jgi:hypothetical protein